MASDTDGALYGQDFSDIPINPGDIHNYNFSYAKTESGPEMVELYVPRPLAGDYELQVIGKWKGAYTLSIEVSDREMVFSTKDFRNVMIHKGEKHTYKLHFVKEDGRKTEIFGSVACHPFSR